MIETNIELEKGEIYTIDRSYLRRKDKNNRGYYLFHKFIYCDVFKFSGHIASGSNVRDVIIAVFMSDSLGYVYVYADINNEFTEVIHLTEHHRKVFDQSFNITTIDDGYIDENAMFLMPVNILYQCLISKL